MYDCVLFQSISVCILCLAAFIHLLVHMNCLVPDTSDQYQGHMVKVIETALAIVYVDVATVR